MRSFDSDNNPFISDKDSLMERLKWKWIGWVPVGLYKASVGPGGWAVWRRVFFVPGIDCLAVKIVNLSFEAARKGGHADNRPR